MIDHYDDLPNVMVFMHSERYQWHNDDPIYGTFPPSPDSRPSNLTQTRWSPIITKSPNPLHHLPRLRQSPLRLDLRLSLRAQAHRPPQRSPLRPQIRQNNRNRLPRRLQRALPQRASPRCRRSSLLCPIRPDSAKDPRTAAC